MTDTPDLMNLTVRDFLHATAAKAPTPGGGSVAGLVGALSVALGEMSLNFSKGKKALAEHAGTHDALAGRLEKMRGLFMDLLGDDVIAYTMYTEATQLDEGPEKAEKLELSLAASIDVPREMAKLALALLDDLRTLAGCCNRMLISDLIAAAQLAAATAALCHFNVRINACNLEDRTVAKELLAASGADRLRARELADTIEQTAEPLIR
jgi:formiminotetrahydrofolate cyclodeaminase